MTATMCRCVAIALLLFAACLVQPARSADPKPVEATVVGDKMIEKYLATEVARISKKELDGATTRAEWEKKRPRLRQEYFEMLGLWPLPEKTPLIAAVTGTIDGNGFVI